METSLLPEFTDRRREQLLTGFRYAFGDRPGTGVAMAPEGAARMGEEQFQLAMPAPEEEQPGAAFGASGHHHGLDARGTLMIVILA